MILLLFLYHLPDSWPSLIFIGKLRQHEESDKEFVYFILHPYRSHSQFLSFRRPSCFRSFILCVWIRICFLCFYSLHWYPWSLVHFVLLSCLSKLFFWQTRCLCESWLFMGERFLSWNLFQRKIKSLFGILSFLHYVKKDNISRYTALNIKWRKKLLQ